jgi:beta-galactosidase/beta-glucuronidase
MEPLMTTSRRTFLAMITSAAAAPRALFAASAPAAPASEGAISLAGDWRFALDPSDVGAADYWFNKVMPSDLSIRLPGLLQTQGYGNEITADTQFVAALPRDMRWYLLPQYQAYTTPGNVKVPYLSQPIRHYLGVAWYQRDIEIPPAWAGKRVTLHLERTRWRTDVWLGNRLVGSDKSLVAPHDFDLGILQPGVQRLTIRIDNSMQEPVYRPDGHGVSDGEGSTWNGVVGRIELSATSPVWLDDVQVHPDLAARAARVQMKIGNLTGKAGAGVITAGGASLPVSWTAEGGSAAVDVPMPDAKPWNEFTPNLQKLTVTLTGTDADHAREITFGMREIRTDGRRILLNGEVFNMRGTHDGGGFPLTGYPATDVETWTRIFTICKRWGLNGMRIAGARPKRPSSPPTRLASISSPNARCGTTSTQRERCSPCSTTRRRASSGPTATTPPSSCSAQATSPPASSTASCPNGTAAGRPPTTAASIPTGPAVTRARRKARERPSPPTSWSSATTCAALAAGSARTMRTRCSPVLAGSPSR